MDSDNSSQILNYEPNGSFSEWNISFNNNSNVSLVDISNSSSAEEEDYCNLDPELDAKEVDVSECYIRIMNYNPPEFAVPIYGYIFPFAFLVSLITNSLIIIVMSRKHMRTTTNINLMAIAMSDLAAISFPAPWYFYAYTLSNYASPFCSAFTCYAYLLMEQTLRPMFHTLSIWLTVIVAAQRYIYICHPFRSLDLCSFRNLNLAFLLAFILSLLQEMMGFSLDKVETIPLKWGGAPCDACFLLEPEWMMVSFSTYESIYYVGRVIFAITIPCIVLVVLNILLIRTLRSAEKRKQELKGGRSSKKSTDKSITTMLVIVVSVFLLVELPVAFCLLINTVNKLRQFATDNYVGNSAMVFVNFITMTSPILNFVIYFMMSGAFKETLYGLFKSWKDKDGGGEGKHSQASVTNISNLKSSHATSGFGN